MPPVIDLHAVRRQLRPGGEPPDNGGMETRVIKLEALAEKTVERLAAIDTRLICIETKMDQFATKEDVAALRGELRSESSALRGETSSLRGEMRATVAEAKNSIIMWVFSAILLAQLLPALLKKLGL